jgi:hypothetical protein
VNTATKSPANNPHRALRLVDDRPAIDIHSL